MENKPSVDLGLLAPIILGVLSIIGIGAVFFIQRANALQPIEVPDTATPFRYAYLGTEPGVSTQTLEPTATETPIFSEPSVPTEDIFFTATSAPTRSVTQAPARTATPTASETLQAVLSKFDDTYFEILYDGDWTAQSNVTDAFQNTLHISFEAGNYALFTFVGEQIIVSYQAGPSLGEILITIDGLEYPAVSQSNGSTILVSWPSPQMVLGTHEIIIEHLSGGSVNLDSITIPDLRTPTPTLTSTP